MDEPDERQTRDEELIKQAYVYFRLPCRLFGHKEASD